MPKGNLIESGILLNFLSEFLSKRSFFVAIDNEKSNIFHIGAWVIQGSVLKTLYNIYSTDLKKIFFKNGLLQLSIRLPKNLSTILKNFNIASKSLSNDWKIKHIASKAQTSNHLFPTTEDLNDFFPMIKFLLIMQKYHGKTILNT